MSKARSGPIVNNVECWRLNHDVTADGTNARSSFVTVIGDALDGAVISCLTNSIAVCLDINLLAVVFTEGSGKMSTRASLSNIMIGLLCLSACTFRRPNDLYVDKVEALNIPDGSATASGLRPNPSPNVFKIDVATATGLAHVADSFGSEARFTILFCGPSHDWGPRSAVRYPDLLSGEHGNIGASTDARGIFHYTILIYVSENPAPYDTRLYYNLLSKPQDICISAFGGNETGFSYRSNEAVASRAQIIAALRPSHPKT